MRKLHPNQERLLELLRRTVDNPLTMVELMEELSISSTSVVHHHILQLEKKGRLKRNPSNPKDYQLLDEPEKPICYLNFYGMAQCGPSGTFLDDTPEDRIPIASRLLKFPASEAFMVRAKGDSMAPVVNSGDLIIAQRTSFASNGDIVVCTNDGEVHIKTFHKDGDTVILHSENSARYRPFIASNTFRVIGKLRNIIKY